MKYPKFVFRKYKNFEEFKRVNAEFFRFHKIDPCEIRHNIDVREVGLAQWNRQREHELLEEKLKREAREKQEQRERQEAELKRKKERAHGKYLVTKRRKALLELV